MTCPDYKTCNLKKYTSGSVWNWTLIRSRCTKYLLLVLPRLNLFNLFSLSAICLLIPNTFDAFTAHEITEKLWFPSCRQDMMDIMLHNWKITWKLATQFLNCVCYYVLYLCQTVCLTNIIEQLLLLCMWHSGVLRWSYDRWCLSRRLR